MNVRIQEQSLKFKITHSELGDLLKGQKVQSALNLPQANFRVCILPCGTINELQVRMTSEKGGDVMSLIAPQRLLQKLQDLGRNRDGVTGQFGNVRLTLQVDYRKEKNTIKQIK